MTAGDAVAMAIEDASLIGGMPLPFVMALVTLGGSVLTVVVTQMIKRFRTPEDTREDKVVVLEASDKLIERFQQIVKDSDEKHAREIKELSNEVGTLRTELNEVRQDRIGLLWGIRQIARIARKYGGPEADLEIQQLEIAPSVLLH